VLTGQGAEERPGARDPSRRPLAHVDQRAARVR